MVEIYNTKQKCCKMFLAIMISMELGELGFWFDYKLQHQSSNANYKSISIRPWSNVFHAQKFGHSKVQDIDLDIWNKFPCLMFNGQNKSMHVHDMIQNQ
jgi:hypothetical protein